MIKNKRFYEKNALQAKFLMKQNVPQVRLIKQNAPQATLFINQNALLARLIKTNAPQARFLDWIVFIQYVIIFFEVIQSLESPFFNGLIYELINLWPAYSKFVFPTATAHWCTTLSLLLRFYPFD